MNRSPIDDSIPSSPSYQTSNKSLPRPYLGSIPPGWELRVTSTGQVCFFDHNTGTTSWDHPTLRPNLDDNTLQDRLHTLRQKFVDFMSQPTMRALPGKCEIKVRRYRVLEDSYGAVMALTADDLKTQLTVNFEGEDSLDYGGVSR